MRLIRLRLREGVVLSELFLYGEPIWILAASWFVKK